MTLVLRKKAAIGKRFRKKVFWRLYIIGFTDFSDLLKSIQNLLKLSVNKVTRNNSLETCARLFFMLLQDFFASTRLHRVQKNFCYQKVVHYLCHLKSNHIIGQSKTTNAEKHLSMIDYLQIANIYCKYCTLTVQTGSGSYHIRNKLIDSWL